MDAQACVDACYRCCWQRADCDRQPDPNESFQLPAELVSSSCTCEQSPCLQSPTWSKPCPRGCKRFAHRPLVPHCKTVHLRTGHSQGTTMALAAFASDPALSQRITAAALLAPVAFLQHLESPPIRALAAIDTNVVSHVQ